MRNGQYEVNIETPIGETTGVIMFKDGKLWGGNTSVCFLGSYESTSRELIAIMQTDRHPANSDTPSIFGADRVTIHARGPLAEGYLSLVGLSPQVPAMQFSVRGRHLRD